MGIENRVLPHRIEKAKALENERKELIHLQQLLFKQMDRANRSSEKAVYFETCELRKKYIEKEREIEKQLSSMYMEKLQDERTTEKEKVIEVAQRLEDVEGRLAVVEKIRRNA
ncbi:MULTISPECIES: hypothetical protein [Bacillus]|uniref:hypothetical protein n=1 Tax=Bacillus TaxID=1386 RepID=UPI0003657383|nr:MULTISPECIES: hypothetical protein [Bacillus]MED1539118.1 hypothetical protein [Bacillus pseudomycoides]PGC41449.1 hypothetical protein COM18_11085 [Bacillus pseudomycoides]